MIRKIIDKLILTWENFWYNNKGFLRDYNSDGTYKNHLFFGIAGQGKRFKIFNFIIIDTMWNSYAFSFDDFLSRCTAIGKKYWIKVYWVKTENKEIDFEFFIRRPARINPKIKKLYKEQLCQKLKTDLV